VLFKLIPVGVVNALENFVNSVITVIVDSVEDRMRMVMLEFTVDDPNAGGPVICSKCATNTESGICPDCQPMAHSRLPNQA